MYHITIDIIDKKIDTKSMYIFYQKHVFAIFNTGTMFLNLYFFVMITKIIIKKAAKNKIPQPRVNQEFLSMNCACFSGLKKGNVFPK